jgi:hypothetical protein
MLFPPFISTAEFLFLKTTASCLFKFSGIPPGKGGVVPPALKKFEAF